MNLKTLFGKVAIASEVFEMSFFQVVWYQRTRLGPSLILSGLHVLLTNTNDHPDMQNLPSAEAASRGLKTKTGCVTVAMSRRMKSITL